MEVSNEFKRQLRLAREVLKAKGAPIEGTAAGHLLLALEALLIEDTRHEKQFRAALERLNK